MAVKTKPGLEPETVARAEPDRQHVVVGQEHVGERLGLVSRNRNLKTVLAGVAGARDEAIEVADAARTGIHESHRGNVWAKLGQNRFGFRPLQGDQGAIGERLDHAHVRQMRAQMGLVLGLAGGIDHQEQMAAEIRHHQIVEDAAAFVGEQRVTLPSRRDRHDVLRHQPLQRQRGISDLAGFRPQCDLAHMGDVEQAGAAAGMQMFPEHAGGILHRHVVAGERHHFAAQGHMQRMQGGVFQGRLRITIVLVRKHHGSPRGFGGDQPPQNP